MAIEPLAVGDPSQVAGYQLQGRLGAGGMGAVYLTFTPGGRPLALKVIRPELGGDPDFRSRFRREVDAAQRVHSLYTAPLMDADPDADPPWLVTAYVAGPSLAAAVQAHGPMPANTVLLLAAGVAEALAVIHRVGLVHRDLKPSNVLLAGDGPRLIDFGIARALDGTALTSAGMRIGTPQYMAPEQVRGDTVTAAADIFTLGATAAYAALGRVPFGEGESAAVLYRIQHQPPDLAGCPAQVRPLLEWCMAKDPADRPAPAQIIEACQEGAAVRTIEYGDAWLPPALTADLPAYAAAVHGLHGTTAQTAATATQQHGRDGQIEAVPAGLRRRGRFPLRWLAPAVAGTLIAGGLAAYALASGGNVKRAADHHDAVTTTGRLGHHRAAGRSANATPGLDSCLFGSWKGVSQSYSDQLNSNVDVVFSGTGPTQIFTKQGVTITRQEPSITDTAQSDGVTYKVVENGSATASYTTRNGMLYESDIRDTSGTWTLYRDGTYSNTGAAGWTTGAYPYTCTANTLTLYGQNNWTENLTRETSPAASSPGVAGKKPKVSSTPFGS
jgi:hypothetical protein